MKSQYRKLMNFAPNNKSLEVENPISYCIGDTIDRNFNHGASNSYIYGCQSKPCQAFMSSYCAQDGGWDGFCEYSAQNTNVSYPNQLQPWNGGVTNLTSGQILIRNTAAKRFLKEMTGPCKLKVEPFDPTVPTSPMIAMWEPMFSEGISGEDACKPIYSIRDTKDIDRDPVMNKLLDDPTIGFDILVGILNTMRKEGRLSELKGTRLGTFFNILLSRGL